MDETFFPNRVDSVRLFYSNIVTQEAKKPEIYYPIYTINTLNFFSKTIVLFFPRKAEKLLLVSFN